MDTLSDNIALTFDGNGVKPSTVKASEVAELIKSFEFAIADLLKLQSEGFRDDVVYLSLDEIQDNCLTLKYKTHSAIVSSAYATIATAFATGNYDSIPMSALNHLNTFIRFAKNHHCNGLLTLNGEPIAQFNEWTELKYTDEGTLTGETVIYGEVKKAGGEDPSVTLFINNRYSSTFALKKEIAIGLAANLYKEVGLKGRALWDKKTYKILDFAVESIIGLDEQPLSETFTELSVLFGDHLDSASAII